MNGNQGSSTGLSTHVAGTLAYVGLWVSGIVFLFIETKDRIVRFHAMQSTITFVSIHTVMLLITVTRGVLAWGMNGTAMMADAVLAVIQSLIFALSVALWIILMIWTYQRRMTVLPLAGELAAWALDRIDGTTSYATLTGAGAGAESRARAERHARHVSAGEHTRAGRIAGSVVAILWSVFLFIMFNVYPEYIAYYQGVAADGISQLLRYPILTAELNSVLPILNVTLGITIIGHIIAIIFDYYTLRQVLEIVVHAFSIAVAAAFLRVFPFDFSQVPLGGVSEAAPTIVIVVLVIAIVAQAIDIVVRIVRLTAHVVTRDRA
jgi:uncharacterized membrane protein